MMALEKCDENAVFGQAVISANPPFPGLMEYRDSRDNPGHGDNPMSYRFDLKNIIFSKADLLFWFSWVEANNQTCWFFLGE